MYLLVTSGDDLEKKIFLELEIGLKHFSRLNMYSRVILSVKLVNIDLGVRCVTGLFTDE